MKRSRIAIRNRYLNRRLKKTSIYTSQQNITHLLITTKQSEHQCAPIPTKSDYTVPGTRGEFRRRSLGGGFLPGVLVVCWGGEGVRERVSAPVPESALLLPLFVSGRPLISGGLGGLVRRDRGVGVEGGELELETGLVPSFVLSFPLMWQFGPLS